MKKITIFSLLILFLSTGCSKKVTSDMREISLILWGEHRELVLYKENIASFEKSHPEVKVKLIHVGDVGQYQKKLITMAAGNQLPDVIRISEWQMLGMVDKDIFLPLDSLISSDPKMNKEEFCPLSFKNYTYENHIYAIPHVFQPMILYYNQNLFDKEGLSYPNRDWKWDDLLEASKRLTRDIDEDGKIDQYGFMTGPQFLWWASFLWQNEGEFMTKDGRRWILADPEYKANNIEALQFMVNLIHKYKVALDLENTEKAVSPLHLFMTGRVAMWICGPWVCLPHKEIKEFKWNIAELPYQKRRAVLFNGAAYCISKRSKHSKEAFELIKHFTSEEIGKKMEKVGLLMSPRKEIYGKYFLSEMPELNREVFVSSLEHGYLYPTSTLWYKIKEEIFDQEIEKAFLNLTSPEETIENIERRVKEKSWKEMKGR